MSRLLRIDIENGIYHVTRRGWERRVIVRDDRDREHWLNLLDRMAVRCGWRNKTPDQSRTSPTVDQEKLKFKT